MQKKNLSNQEIIAQIREILDLAYTDIGGYKYDKIETLLDKLLYTS